MNKLYLLLLFSLFLSCNKKQADTENTPDNENLESSLIVLEYPSGYGHSGDSLTNVLGYGFDATGLIDTLSVKAKVLNLANKDHLEVGHVNTAGPGIIISGFDFNNLIEYYNYTEEPKILFESHLKSLLKLANESDSINYQCAYAYYCIKILHSFFVYYINTYDINSEITPEFSNDLNSFTAEQIVKKYGTHVLKDIFTGTKFEVLYKCKIKNFDHTEVEGGLCKRMNEFFGGTPYLIPSDEIINYSQSSEQLIYNSLGSKVKLCGLINATDNNPNGIFIHFTSLFNDNIKYQFIKVAKDGLIPLYDLISDPVKKQEVKTFIESYVSIQKY